MQKCATSSKSPSKTGGFTLVELLTVLVIIGLMSSAVVMTLPREKSAVLIEAKTLHRSLNIAAQESLLSGHTHALAVSETGYEIREAFGDSWTVQRQSDWPDGTRVDFTRNEARLDLPKTFVPLVMFEPTGGATIFEMTLSDLDHTITLESRGDGKVMWTAGP